MQLFSIGSFLHGSSFPVDQPNVVICIVHFRDVRIDLRTITEFTQGIHFRYIDKLPLYQLLLVIVKNVFLPEADLDCFFESVRQIGSVDQTDLFVELRCMCAIAANNLVNDSCSEPIHMGSIRVVNN